MEFNKLIMIACIIILTGCLRDDTINESFNSFSPAEIMDGLNISTPQAEGIDPLKLESVYSRVYTDKDLWSLRSLLVFKNNKLVSEAYLKNGNDITNRHLIWSSTKQVLAIITGIALDKGLISSLSAPLSEFLTSETNAHPDKADITLQQLLTMNSGIDYDNDDIGGETDKILRQIPANITSFILSRPMKTSPGTEFLYKDGDPQIVSAIIQHVTGKPTDAWADEVFFSKIGVTNYNWVRYKDGTTLGGFGIETTPRELGKIAICVAEKGRYNNDQIVSEEWIDEMTSPKVITPLGYSFGYYWWVDTSRNIHFMWGHGGQYVFIIPSKSLIVIMTAFPNTQGDYQLQDNIAMNVVDDIIKSCL